MSKRLFLFAGYDKNGIIDDALIYYVQNLATYGDVILCMDSDCDDVQLTKIKPFTIYAMAKRHGEYDFGSYKRCFQYARDNDLLKNYDVMYLVNDSVFGPMFNMANIIKGIENLPTDAGGMVISKHKTHTFMESWFVRLNKNIFISKWFDKFMSAVTKEIDKDTITIKYEHGLTNLIRNNNCSCSGLYEFYGRFTYNKPKTLFKLGCPFVKKASFIRHNGACGNQIKYILKHADKIATQSVMITANRVYGAKYMNKLLTYNPIKIMMRNINYLIKKITNGDAL